MENWDKIEAQKLREQGLTQDQIGFVIGMIAEHRMNADLVGASRGYDIGYTEGHKKGYLHCTRSHLQLESEVKTEEKPFKFVNNAKNRAYFDKLSEDINKSLYEKNKYGIGCRVVCTVQGSKYFGVEGKIVSVHNDDEYFFVDTIHSNGAMVGLKIWEIGLID